MAVDTVTEAALRRRIRAHQEHRRGTDQAADVHHQPVSHYVDPGYAAAESAAWFGPRPLVVGLSDLVPRAGYHTDLVASRPVLLTRDDDGRFRAFLNVCRHRGAPVAEGRGCTAALVCPYHGWTYGLDGSLRTIRRAAAFGEIDVDGLVELPALEEHGVLWVTPDPHGEAPLDPLAGAEVELGPFSLGTHHLFAQRSWRREINWKLAVDTFGEAYHVGVLHSASLAPMIHSDFALFDAFGPHGRLVSARRSLDHPDAAPGVVAHATILYFLVPNTVLIHQQDHVQLYQAWPGPTPDECELTVSLYVPEEPTTDKAIRYWQKNLDLLVSVTDSEDFALCAEIQKGFHSGAQTHLTFGRNEPALHHLHRSLDGVVAG